MKTGEPAMVLRDVRVAMRDGVRLATDVYLPPGAGPFPVLLERTPYGKSVDSNWEHSAADLRMKSRAEVAQFFVGHGYAVVYQDCRGRFGSEGDFVKYANEPADGFDTCEWLLQQPWCAGRIGTFGLSYAAHVQLHLASAGAPGLAAMCIDSGGFSDAYQGGVRQGGAYEMKQALWCYRHAQTSPEMLADPARLEALKKEDMRAWLAKMPWSRGNSPLSAAPLHEDYLFEQWERGAFDDYWKQIHFWGLGHHERVRGVPALFMSGHYDIYARAACDNYLGLSPGFEDRVRLVLGPWIHGGRSLTHAGDVEYGPAGTLDGNLAPDFLQFRLRWFDRWMKDAGARRDENAGAQRDENASARRNDEPAVQVFVMGGGSGGKTAEGRLEHGGRWRHESRWPIPGVRDVTYYLADAGHLSIAGPPERAGSIAYDYDPASPVPTIGGAVANGEPFMSEGGFDQRESKRTFGATPPYRKLEDRDDVLVFRTDPLEADVEVVGAIDATLWISSDCLDTDFTLKLIDEYPPSADWPEGFALNVADGIVRARYRDSFEEPKLLTPGVPVQVRIETFPTANRFVRGHRIRVDISSSNFPHFDANPNTGEPEGRATHLKVARNEVHFGGARPSSVRLPVVGG